MFGNGDGFSLESIIIICLLLFTFAALVIVYFYLIQKQPKDKIAPRAAPVRRDEAVNQRRQQALNQRARLRANARAQHSENEEDAIDDDDDVNRPLIDFDDKLGAKKRAKLEAKAEKKAQRESEQKVRDDKKKREALADEDRKQLEEKERAEEIEKEQIERLAREEQERKEHEEYLQMKAAFSVEEEGYEEEGDDESGGRLQEFIQFIKDSKVVVLEDLAAHYKMKTQAVIDRIMDLKSDGNLTGVIDDRGKFIYISTDELNSVGKFIKNHGRISIADLANHSNSLISLNSKTM